MRLSSSSPRIDGLGLFNPQPVPVPVAGDPAWTDPATRIFYPPDLWYRAYNGALLPKTQAALDALGIVSATGLITMGDWVRGYTTGEGGQFSFATDFTHPQFIGTYEHGVGAFKDMLVTAAIVGGAFGLAALTPGVSASVPVAGSVATPVSVTAPVVSAGSAIPTVAAAGAGSSLTVGSVGSMAAKSIAGMLVSKGVATVAGKSRRCHDFSYRAVGADADAAAISGAAGAGQQNAPLLGAWSCGSAHYHQIKEEWHGNNRST